MYRYHLRHLRQTMAIIYLSPNQNLRMKIHKAVLSGALLLGLVQAMGVKLSAQTVTWDPGLTPVTGSYGSGTWDLNTTTDWSNGTTDGTYQVASGGGTGSTSNAIFGGTSTGSATVSISGTQLANTLTFNSAGYTLSGGAITLTASNAVDNVIVNANTTINATGDLSNFSAISVATGDTLTLSSTDTTTTTSSTSATGNGGFLSTQVGNSALTGGGTVDLTAGTFSVTTSVGSNVANNSTTTGGLVVGGTSELYLGNNSFEIGRNAAGLVTVNGGSIVSATGTGGQLTVGRSSSGGALVINSGSVINTQPSSGNGDQSVAVFVGRDGSTGTVTNNGGTLTVSNILDLGADSIQNNNKNSGTLNITGGTTSLGALVFNGSDTNEAGNGASTPLLVTDSANTGTNTGTTSGTLNVTGGTLLLGTTDTIASNVQGQGIVNLASAAQATVNLSGGTIGASANWTSNVAMNLTKGTNGNVTFQLGNSVSNFSIGLNGVLSGAGGLKISAPAGGGTGIALTLGATNTYTGNTEVEGNAQVTLAVNTALAALSTLTLDAAGVGGTVFDGKANLDYTGVDFIAGLTIDGVNLAPGIYGASSSGVDGDLTGTGLLDVGNVAVPEPSTWAMLFVGLGALVIMARRRSANLL
jgi:PEP-CTERM motif